MDVLRERSPGRGSQEQGVPFIRKTQGARQTASCGQVNLSRQLSTRAFPWNPSGWRAGWSVAGGLVRVLWAGWRCCAVRLRALRLLPALFALCLRPSVRRLLVLLVVAAVAALVWSCRVPAVLRCLPLPFLSARVVFWVVLCVNFSPERGSAKVVVRKTPSWLISVLVSKGSLHWLHGSSSHCRPVLYSSEESSAHAGHSAHR